MCGQQRPSKRCRREPDEADVLQAEILEIEQRERRLGFELLDVMSEVLTEGTDDEEEDDEIDFQPGLSVEDEALLRRTVEADAELAAEVPYADLYTDPQYKTRVDKKIKEMKRVAKNCKFVHQKKYRKELTRLKEQYSADGRSAELFELIALFLVAEYEEGDPDTDDESDEKEKFSDSDFDEPNAGGAAPLPVS